MTEVGANLDDIRELIERAGYRPFEGKHRVFMFTHFAGNRFFQAFPGLDEAGTFALPVDLPSSRYPEERVAGFYRELQDRLRAVPGVTAVGAT